MKALVIGATGATGKDLVQQILVDEYFTEVHIFIRKPINISHKKLHIHIVDFNKPKDWEHLLYGDIAFSCLGTTIKQAGSKNAQKIVDYDYQLNFAKNTAKNQVKTFVLVSAMGANHKSILFYQKIKGQLEIEIKKLPFQRIVIIQPSLLIRKNNNRITEKIAEKIIKTK